MRRIAHYAPAIWAQGGIASYIRRLGLAQEKAGYDVYYFTRKLPDHQSIEHTVQVGTDRHLFEVARDLGIDILHLHKPVGNLPADRVPTVRTMHGNQGSCPSGTRFLARSERPCDRPYSLTGCLKNHLTERCGSLRPSKVRNSFVGIRHEHALGRHLHTFTVSRFLRERMVRSGYPSERLHVLHSPAPETPFEPSPPPDDAVPHFLFLGRLVPQKGAQWLLRALASVSTPVRLDIGGEGPLLDGLKAFCHQHDLEDKVLFHGWIDPNRIWTLMSKARAIIIPSLWQEPAGLVTLEAAAAGRAVIASRAGGIPEYALEAFSVLVSPNNTGQLAAAIERLALDHALAKQLGARGRQQAKTRYAMSSFLERQLALYSSALDAGQHHCVKH